MSRLLSVTTFVLLPILFQSYFACDPIKQRAIRVFLMVCYYLVAGIKFVLGLKMIVIMRPSLLTIFGCSILETSDAIGVRIPDADVSQKFQNDISYTQRAC